MPATKGLHPSNGDQHFLRLVEIDDEPVSVAEMSRALQKLSSENPGLIMVLASDDSIDLIFKLAYKHNMLGLDVTWALVEFNEKRLLTKLPIRVLNLNMNRPKHEWSNTQISKIIEVIR